MFTHIGIRPILERQRSSLVKCTYIIILAIEGNQVSVAYVDIAFVLFNHFLNYVTLIMVFYYIFLFLMAKRAMVKCNLLD